MGFLEAVFWVVILLGIMILVHELGHFGAALAVGVKVETFSIGFGKRLFGFKRGNTDFRISAIPIGGYVRMHGDQPGEEAAAVRPNIGSSITTAPALDSGAFYAKPRWQRAIVIIAGPLMNVILAIAIVTGLYMHGFAKESSQAGEAIISSVDANSPAAQAGLQPGDKILDLAGHRNPSWSDVLMQTALNGNHTIPVVVDRKGQNLKFSVRPQMDAKEGVGIAGWRGGVEVGEVQKGSPAQKAGLLPGDSFVKVNGQTVSSLDTVRQAVIHSKGEPIEMTIMRTGEMQKVELRPVPYTDPKMPWHIGITFKLPIQWVKLGFGPALVESVRFNQQNALLIFQLLGSIVERRVSPRTTLAGPIQIAQMSSEAAQEGPFTYLSLMAILSLNLAIFNLLPIPILDGGTLLLLIIEMLLQREVTMQVKETVFKLGFVFLMMIVVFVIYNDISRILTRS